VADQDLVEQLRRLSRARIDRRGFLAGVGLAAGAALVAACAPETTPTAAPSVATPSAAPPNGTPLASVPASATAGATAAATAAPTPAPTLADIGDTLFMYNWSDYVNPANVDEFKKRYNLSEFKIDIFSSNEELLTRLQGGATNQWDIGAPTAEFIPAMRDQGFLQKLDVSRIPNVGNINKSFKGLWWDPTDEWQVPKDWGTTGLAVRTKLVTEPLTSWKQFFALAPKYSGRIVLVDSPGDVFTAPLKALGYSLNSVDPKELGEARDLLMGLAPHVLALDSEKYADKLRTEEAVMALCWTGTVLPLRDDPKTADTVYFVPDEGSLFWMNSWVIFADPPHLDAAYAWMDFIQEPAIQAQETVFTTYATPNDAARALLDPKVVADIAIFPPDDVLARCEGAKDVSTDPLRLQIWKDFKKSIGKG
jgi:spermidine/putrescine transport system substrate-binding protein